MDAGQENMVLRTVYLPKTLDLDLKKRAFTLSMTKNELIRDLVREALALRDAKGKTLADGAKVAVTKQSKIKETRVPRRKEEAQAAREAVAA